MRRFLRWLLRPLTRTRAEAPDGARVQEDESNAWPSSMKGVKAIWTPKGYVLHRKKSDGTLEVLHSNPHQQTRLGMPGYGGTPPGVGYG
jgi:hypothetical protein